MSAQDGGPAFPGPVDGPSVETGMTLRDYFAGQALVGLMASETSVQALHHVAEKNSESWAQSAAYIAYGHANAMLKVRDHEPR